MLRALAVAAIVLGSAVALAQRAPVLPPARDAGTASDAGVEAAAVPALSLGRQQALELQKLRDEVSELRAKTSEALGELKARAVELERSQAKADARADKLAKQVDQLRAELTQAKEAEERRQDAERATATRKAQTAQANAALGGALQQLATGATAVDGALRTAEASYSGNALELVRLARASLANGDLNAARQLLTLAIIEADAAR